MQFESSEAVMQHALALASRGIGRVEPNPAVGAVVVDDARNLLGEGYHQQFGGPHAEVFALQQAGEKARGATLYVTLEPCAHHGKTPPCAEAVVAAGIRRVIIAMQDPFPRVDGRGMQILEQAGIEMLVGLCEDEARQLTAPFRKRVETALPYVHAKWAMTVDGRIATSTGDSKWISGEESRALVHQLRGRMDAVLAGIGTVLADDPLLNARTPEPSPRTPVRVILDSQARLPIDSQLVATASDSPVLVIASERADHRNIAALRQRDVEVLQLSAQTSSDRVDAVLAVLEELGRREMTNVLVEGGGVVLGSFFDAQQIDEAHVFIGPKVVGSQTARSPVLGHGIERLADATQLQLLEHRALGNDAYLRYATRPAQITDEDEI